MSFKYVFACVHYDTTINSALRFSSTILVVYVLGMYVHKIAGVTQKHRYKTEHTSFPP